MQQTLPDHVETAENARKNGHSWRLLEIEKESSWPHCKATPPIPKKVECWNDIASAINAADPAGPRRDGRECKKKWTDLKSAVVRYRSDLMRTGGGEPPKIPEYFETVGIKKPF
ncbi:hypothetical protein RRG08_011368 [Elysia crispata]|uniref:Myb/SANT-like DNA-binding domain-containing protein n=1 Tax=Elysia crispata TaxID=231223 RepID=A0AAE1DJ92_9GAST|nr:hypothetical protein RRG08_011368 [Elysia crispata]